MRRGLISIVHLTREHRSLAHKLRVNPEDQEARHKKDELTDRLIESMSEELLDLARELDSLKARTNRNRHF